MLFAYREATGRLERLFVDDPLDGALWIDLYRPLDRQVQAVEALGVTVPSLEDMEEIEISNRLYREGGVDYMTVVLPGLSESKAPISGPVTFMLMPGRLVTVRHHAPRPFETYPQRADKVGPGCATPEMILLGLLEEIVGRLADLMEGSGKALDQVMKEVFTPPKGDRSGQLEEALQRIGREGDLVGRVRLSLLTLERMVSFYGQGHDAQGAAAKPLRPAVKGLMRDIQALEVHADFLSSRVALAVDATLGMISLSQSQTIKMFSVLAVVFLPPTVIASAYGMNFDNMPELHWDWGYPMALGLMLASTVGTYLFFKWKSWF
jgi:magnesium transporter